MMRTQLKSAAIVLAFTSAAVMAAVPGSPITPTSPSSPTAGDNGSLLLIVYDNVTGRSIVEDLSLTISQIQPADMDVPGTVLDFGSVNLSQLNGSASTSLAANQHYLVVAADYQANPTGTASGGGGGIAPPIYSGAGNNIYVTGSDYSALTDAGKVEQSSQVVSSFLSAVFNSATKCNHANPCSTLADRDSRYFGTSAPGGGPGGGGLNSPPPYNADLGFAGTGTAPSGLVGAALNFFALNTIGNDQVDNDNINSNTISKTQYAGQFLLDGSGHLTYTVAGPALPNMLAVTLAGTGSGTVTSDSGGVNCPGTCSHGFDPNTVVVLTAAAATGSSFTGWGGACSGTQTTCTVTMTAAQAVTAGFDLQQPVQQALAVTLTGTGSGSVVSNPNGINCGTACSASYDASTQVTLTATAASGSSFSGWSGACSGAGTTCSVTLDSAKSVSAAFTTAAVNDSSSGGSSASSGGGGAFDWGWLLVLGTLEIFRVSLRATRRFSALYLRPRVSGAFFYP